VPAVKSTTRYSEPGRPQSRQQSPDRTTTGTEGVCFTGWRQGSFCGLPAAGRGVAAHGGGVALHRQRLAVPAAIARALPGEQDHQHHTTPANERHTPIRDRDLRAKPRTTATATRSILRVTSSRSRRSRSRRRRCLAPATPCSSSSNSTGVARQIRPPAPHHTATPTATPTTPANAHAHDARTHTGPPATSAPRCTTPAVPERLLAGYVRTNLPPGSSRSRGGSPRCPGSPPARSRPPGPVAPVYLPSSPPGTELEPDKKKQQRPEVSSRRFSWVARLAAKNSNKAGGPQTARLL